MRLNRYCINEKYATYFTSSHISCHIRSASGGAAANIETVWQTLATVVFTSAFSSRTGTFLF